MYCYRLWLWRKTPVMNGEVRKNTGIEDYTLHVSGWKGGSSPCVLLSVDRNPLSGREQTTKARLCILFFLFHSSHFLTVIPKTKVSTFPLRSLRLGADIRVKEGPYRTKGRRSTVEDDIEDQGAPTPGYRNRTWSSNKIQSLRSLSSQITGS